MWGKMVVCLDAETRAGEERKKERRKEKKLNEELLKPTLRRAAGGYWAKQQTASLHIPPCQ